MGKIQREPGWRSKLMKDLRAKPDFQEGLRVATERKSVIKRPEYFLFLRGAITEEVIQIVGGDREQIAEFKNYLRDRHLLQKSTKEEESEVKRRAHRGKPRNSRGREYSAIERNTFALVGKFCAAGLITEDLSYWNLLHRMYADRERGLLDSFADRLRLEVYLAAMEALGKNDPLVLSRYRMFGDEIDPEWARKSLAQEEAFISIKYFNPWADGEDKRGLYRVTPQGRQYRLVSDADGVMAYDTTRLAIKRSQSRRGQQRFQQES